jgi:hypothetical protein
MRKLMLIAALALLVPATASAKHGPPAAKPLPQAEAEALVGATADVSSGSETRAVSPQEALAAAGLPGALVVGVAPAEATAATACSANAAWHQWGTWPYEQRITDTTYWCAVYGGQITYRSSSVSATGTLCGSNWTTSQLISGGIGYSWFVIRSSAGFSCPTVIPWVTLHPSHYEDIARNSWGSTSEVGSN